MSEAKLKQEIEQLRGDNARLAGALDGIDHASGFHLPANIASVFPTYNGVRKSGVLIEQILNDFLILADSYGLDNKRKALVFICCLKDQAFFKYPEIVKADASKKENYEGTLSKAGR